MTSLTSILLVGGVFKLIHQVLTLDVLDVHRLIELFPIRFLDKLPLVGILHDLDLPVVDHLHLPLAGQPLELLFHIVCHRDLLLDLLHLLLKHI